jgi:hypothetical protein
VDGRPSTDPVSCAGAYGAVELAVGSWVVDGVVDGGGVEGVVEGCGVDGVGVTTDVVISVAGVGVVAGGVGVVGTSVAAGASTGTTVLGSGTTMFGSGVGAGRTRTYNASVSTKTPIRTTVEVRGRWRIKKPGAGPRFPARRAR